MSNRSYCGSNKFSQNYRLNNSTNEQNLYKLPTINNGTRNMSDMNPPSCKQSFTRPDLQQKNEDYTNQYTNFANGNNNTANLPSPINCTPSGPAVYNANTPSYNNCKTNSSSQGGTSSSPMSNRCNGMQQTSASRGWSSNQLNRFGNTSILNTGTNKNLLTDQGNNCPQRPMTSGPGSFNRSSSNMNVSNGQKTVVRDRQLANEILQKAGISSNLTANDCLEVITDVPVTMNDNVNCDPNPLCMKKPANCQECYEQSIVVRHLQPPRPPVPPPIIIRERYATQPPPPQPPIIIRQIPPRPSTPPTLIIRQCPPPMPDSQEPTIIDREVPLPPPPPRQVIVERLATPPPKPRPIIFEKWLPYEEPQDRPCIVEKAAMKEMPPPKNVIIHYEALAPRIQSQCINEGISYVDPKQFINDKPNGNTEVCYVNQLDELPDHIKYQLGPQALAAIGIQNDNKQNTNSNPYVVRTNPTAFYQQHGRAPCTSMPPMSSQRSMMTNGYHPMKPPNPHQYRQQQQPVSRALSASAGCLPQCDNKYNTNMLARPGNQGLTNLSRAQYNPWATTYQVSYTNKARGICRAR